MRFHPDRFEDHHAGCEPRITVNALIEAPGANTSIPTVHLTLDELALLSCFRDLPDDETRLACLEALEDFLIS